MKRRLVAVFAGLLAASSPLAALTPPLPPPLPAGPDFQVNATTQGSQDTPDVARDAAGNFVMVWADSELEFTAPSQVKARLYDSSGSPKSGEILVWPVSHSAPRPRVAMTPQGAFVVVWRSESGVSMRRFDRFAEPNSAAFPVAPQASADKHSPDVAMDAAGNAAVVWVQDDNQRIFLQRFDAEDRPLEAPVRVDQAPVGRRDNPRVALNAAGSILVTWDDRRELDVLARRFDGPSGSWGPERRAHAAADGIQEAGAPVLYPEGDGLVVYHDQGAGLIFAQRLNATGAPVGGAIELGGGLGDGLPDAAAALNGTVLATWIGYGFDGDGIYGSLLERNGESASFPFLISTPSTADDFYPSVAGGAAEGFAVAWVNGDSAPIFPITLPPRQDGRDGSLRGVFARVFGDDRCLAGSEVLCLRGGRFETRVTWTNPATGETGVGRALPLTADTGALWFFNEDNLELVVKVLDGGAVNGHFWVYYGALSDVRYILEVTDTETGRKRIYRNPPRRLASRADINAFPNAGAALPVVTPDPKTALAAPASKAVGSCQGSPEALCLAGDRFRVTVEFADPRLGPAVEHQAKAIPLTGDTGTFYFFHAENIELMIKVLDGRPHNGHFWVYYGALSDVAYRITVEDTETGERKTYDNLPGRLISRADVEAF